jgi:hypothetical protein
MLRAAFTLKICADLNGRPPTFPVVASACGFGQRAARRIAATGFVRDRRCDFPNHIDARCAFAAPDLDCQQSVVKIEALDQRLRQVPDEEHREKLRIVGTAQIVTTLRDGVHGKKAVAHLINREANLGLSGYSEGTIRLMQRDLREPSN